MKVYKSAKKRQRGMGYYTPPPGYGGADNMMMNSGMYNGQVGGGLGSIFSTIFRSVVPLFKPIAKIGINAIRGPAGKSLLKQAKKSAMRAGLNVVSDTLQGKNVAKSAKTQAKKAVKSFGKNVQKNTLAALLAPPARNPRLIATAAQRFQRTAKPQKRKQKKKQIKDLWSG